ncbi:MAG: hypothetical protein JW904_14200 [Spirochaetales bacterium]|nr:hypothetical protein [Spirochaetales bacterium]
MHIHGCPQCEPPNGTRTRRCPVCKHAIPPGGFCVGRMWEKPGKMHLHIVGCTECKRQYRVSHSSSRLLQ